LSEAVTWLSSAAISLSVCRRIRPALSANSSSSFPAFAVPSRRVSRRRSSHPRVSLAERCLLTVIFQVAENLLQIVDAGARHVGDGFQFAQEALFKLVGLGVNPELPGLLPLLVKALGQCGQSRAAAAGAHAFSSLDPAAA